MREVARYAVRDNDAVITLDNPPVNDLGNALRAALLELLSKADADATAGVDYHVPFGGRKGSSYGPREQGKYAAEFFTVVKTAYTAAG